MRRGAALIALVTSLLLGLASPVLARSQEEGPRTYEGTHDAGGTIRLQVMPNSDLIRSLELEGIAGGGCSWGTIDIGNWPGPIRIRNEAFQATNVDGDTIRGEFLEVVRAEGTVEVTDRVKGCSSGPLRWVAILTGETRLDEPPAP